MVNVIYNDKLVYKVVIWVGFFFGGGDKLWKEKEALIVKVQ